MRIFAAATIGFVAFTTLSSGHARSMDHPRADAQALNLAKQAIALRSVQGPANQTPQVASLFKSALVSGGFADADVTIHPVDDTAYLIARWKGLDPKLKPLVISGHMDVVEAKPSDWTRDPFTPVVENGFLFGRGSSDMKLDDALAVATLIELKRQGYKPRREIVLELSGDEETTLKTTQMIAKELSNAEMLLNLDGAGGYLDPEGKPQYLAWSGAEKTFADFELTVTSPGGHSSRPYEPNAINEMSAALVRIGNHKFKPELSEWTRSYFMMAARYEAPDVAAAMHGFAVDPTDTNAIAVLTVNPATVGKIGTTCVATMINGGHALNALPQRVSANINCRIFPGHTRAEIMGELQIAAGDPAVQFKDVTEGSIATEASPMRADVLDAITKAIHIGYSGVTVLPTMSAGASDSMWFRNEHIPSYGVSPIFMKDSDRFAHGLNERVPLDSIPPSISYLLSLLIDLSK
jgi:carboxypeptidase PM20D1